MRASGVHWDRPAAPCICMARSMISHTRAGTMAFTALTHTRASALPISSMALAARSTISRMASISIRARAMASVLPPSLARGRPKASRLRPRTHISSRARSAAPMERMQWWMRPGPRRSWEISKPRPSPSSTLPSGTRTSRNRMCMWPWGESSSPSTCMGPTISTPGASMGTRICDCWRWGGASGLVRTMTMSSLQRGSPAPLMKNFSPSITHSPPSRTARVATLRASEEAAPGSVMA